jgi:hypothetical protein
MPKASPGKPNTGETYLLNRYVKLKQKRLTKTSVKESRRAATTCEMRRKCAAYWQRIWMTFSMGKPQQTGMI